MLNEAFQTQGLQEHSSFKETKKRKEWRDSGSKETKDKGRVAKGIATRNKVVKARDETEVPRQFFVLVATSLYAARDGMVRLSRICMGKGGLQMSLLKEFLCS